MNKMGGGDKLVLLSSKLMNKMRPKKLVFLSSKLMNKMRGNKIISVVLGRLAQSCPVPTDTFLKWGCLYDNELTVLAPNATK